MSKQRYVDTKFWDDNYIVERDPIEKLLYLYLLTNTLTNILGIYEISIRRIAFDTGIDKDMVIKILERFEADNKIKYFDGYIVIKNFVKHQADNPKINKGIELLLEETPIDLIKWIDIDFDRLGINKDSLYIGLDKTLKDSNYSNPNINTNTNSNNNNNSNRDSAKNRTILYEQIINYLNTEADKSYKPTTPMTIKLINARLKEGHSFDDFKRVIDIKVEEWKGRYSKDGKNWGDYLRPQTLFSNKFESYLNQNNKSNGLSNYKNDHRFDDIEDDPLQELTDHLK